MILTITFAPGHNDYIKNYSKHPFQNCQEFTLTGYVHEHDNEIIVLNLDIEIFTIEKGRDEKGFKTKNGVKGNIIYFHFARIAISLFHLSTDY